MGALTNNRKRGDEHLSLNHHPGLHLFPPSPDFRSSKKSRLSSAPQGADHSAIMSSKNILSRIAQYPVSTPKLPREVHAPCRVLKFGSRPFRTSANYQRQQLHEDEDAYNLLSFNYDKAKTQALESLQHVKKDKTVIDLDSEPENAVASVDSSIEEAEVIEDGREGRSPVSSHLLRQVNVYEPNLRKDVEPGSVVSELRNSNLKKLDNERKLLDALSLDQDTGMTVAVYKNLLKTAERRNPKLDSLGFQIKLKEKQLSDVRSHPVKKPKEIQKVPQDAFVPLSKEDQDKVACALQPSNRRKVLVTHKNSNIEITGELLQCLRPHAWLNDEVINVYLELLKERESREPTKFLKCHFFNTFFYKKLIGGKGYDYKSVRRWTTQRKLGYGLFECEKIFVPIHKEIHWCLAVINKKEKKFQYLDSLKGRDSQVLNVLARYFVDEVKDKSGIDIDVHSWEQEYVEDLPEQENGYDCGVFMVKYADFYSRGQGLCFSQEHMPYFRVRTAKEILRLRAD